MLQEDMIDELKKMRHSNQRLKELFLYFLIGLSMNSLVGQTDLIIQNISGQIDGRPVAHPCYQ